MKSKIYNAQRQGNEAHLHVQDETGKATLKNTNAKGKIKEQPSKEKSPAKSSGKTYGN